MSICLSTQVQLVFNIPRKWTLISRCLEKVLTCPFISLRPIVNKQVWTNFISKLFSYTNTSKCRYKGVIFLSGDLKKRIVIKEYKGILTKQEVIKYLTKYLLEKIGSR
jgi:hypothetical protein